MLDRVPQNVRKLFLRRGGNKSELEDPGFHCLTIVSDNVYGHFRRLTLTIEADKLKMPSLA
jgi:hypothetical protein